MTAQEQSLQTRRCDLLKSDIRDRRSERFAGQLSSLTTLRSLDGAIALLTTQSPTNHK